MLKIKITQPHLMDKQVLTKIANFLLELSGHAIAPVPRPSPFQPTEQPPITPAPVPMPVPPPPVANVPRETIADVPRHNPFAPIAPGVEKDLNGLPWDGRIHSRTKSKTVDGLWRYMRGIDPAVVSQVESELRQATGAPPIIEETYEAPVAPVFKGSTAGVGSGGSSATFDPTLPPTNDFPALMAKATNAVHSGKLTQARLLEIIQSFGLPSVAVTSTRPDLIPAIMVKIDEAIA